MQCKHAGPLELNLTDQLVSAVEFQNPVRRDERYIPVRSVGLDGDMVWLGIGWESEFLQIDGANDDVSFHIYDRNHRRILVRNIEQLRGVGVGCNAIRVPCACVNPHPQGENVIGDDWICTKLCWMRSAV